MNIFFPVIIMSEAPKKKSNPSTSVKLEKLGRALGMGPKVNIKESLRRTNQIALGPYLEMNKKVTDEDWRTGLNRRVTEDDRRSEANK